MTLPRTRIILLNLLAVTDGGQVTRAKAFLSKFGDHDTLSKLIIVKRKGSLKFCEELEGVKIIDINLGNSFLRPWLRLVWENTLLKLIVIKEEPNIYLTFSHYLPLSISSKIYSIVGVTNLAPFIKESMKNEPLLMKIKMDILKIGIIASAKRAARVIALSQKCKEMLNSSGVNPSKISIISNGVEVQNDSQPSENLCMNKYGITTDYLLYVSSFFPYKKFETVIDAYSLLPAEQQNNFCLMLVGRVQDKNYYDQLINLVARKGLNNKIVFIPEVSRDELLDLYKSSHIFIFASSVENCPNILLEAMSCGCCILCSSDEPMPEFGQASVEYFNSSNSEELSKKISEMIAPF